MKGKWMRGCRRTQLVTRGCLWGPIVLHAEMQIQMGLGLGVELLEEPEALLMPMPGQAIADHVPIEQVQRRKPGRRALAWIGVQPGPTAALLHRQAGLGAIQGLNPACLVHGEPHGLVRRIEIPPPPRRRASRQPVGHG